MKYKLIEQQNPPKWYATPVNDGKAGQQDIALDIVNLSSLARGDAGNVINSVIDTIPKYLVMGKSVNPGELGTWVISASKKANNTFKNYIRM
jgi:nucleoid DNA-binding protein